MLKMQRVVAVVALLAIVALGAGGCSKGAGDKFVGKWKAAQGGKAGQYVEIAKDGSDYTLMIGGDGGASPAGKLTAEGDKLVQKSPDGKTVSELSLEPNGHLKFTMGGMMTLDLERQ